MDTKKRNAEHIMDDPGEALRIFWYSYFHPDKLDLHLFLLLSCPCRQLGLRGLTLTMPPSLLQSFMHILSRMLAWQQH
eukprot:1137860-Pelagomonas_calceolata.AAC.1